MQRKKALVFLTFIAVIAVAAAFFVYPRGFGSRVLPWRLGLDLVGGSHLVYEVDMSAVAEADRSSVSAGLRSVIERRVNNFGVAEPHVVTARSGDSYRLIAELAGIYDVSAAIKEIGETPFLVFAEVEGELNTAADGATSTAVTFKATELTGRYVKGAQITFGQTALTPEISLEFNSEGAKIFEELTGKNVGKQIAVFLDGQIQNGVVVGGELVTAPVVQEAITGGRAQITGTFTREEAQRVVSRFNAGALPAPITLISQETVGASLGVGSLRTTLWAGLVGTVLVALFMLIYYGSFGFFASVALLVYIILNLLVFKTLSVTMTLAGIAGIILSIGMAVDANVLIFERTKEEMKKGLGKAAAIEEGFRRAWLSIRDSNVSTIITSAILYYFTTGFVKGFALALLIGVLISMFSAITITRNLLRAFSK